MMNPSCGVMRMENIIMLTGKRSIVLKAGRTMINTSTRILNWDEFKTLGIHPRTGHERLEWE
jgi:hypothetical protein